MRRLIDLVGELVILLLVVLLLPLAILLLGLPIAGAVKLASMAVAKVIGAGA